MAEPITLTKNGKTLVINAPSYAAQLVAEGWQRVPGNVTIVTEGVGATPDSVVVTEPPAIAKATITPPVAPAVPRGRPKKG